MIDEALTPVLLVYEARAPAAAATGCAPTLPFLFLLFSACGLEMVGILTVMVVVVGMIPGHGVAGLESLIDGLCWYW